MIHARTWSVVTALTALVLSGVLTGSSGAATVTASAPTIALDELLSIAHTPAPPDGVGLQLNIHWPEENPHSIDGVALVGLTANVSSDGTVEIVSFIPASAETEDKGPNDAAGECQDHFFKMTGPRWEAEDIPVVWRFRRNSMPEGMDRAKTIYALRHAHMVWPRVITNCHETDENAFSYMFKGPARADRGMKYDKVNLVDFGALGSGALAVNYTWFSGLRIVEADLRFNRAEYSWTNDESAKYAYQLINVASHELGHQLGLDDLDESHRELTMYGRIGMGEMNKTTLGVGDMAGAAKLSP